MSKRLATRCWPNWLVKLTPTGSACCTLRFAPAHLTSGVRPDGIHQYSSGLWAACPSAVVRATEACGLRGGVTVAQGAVR